MPTELSYKRLFSDAATIMENSGWWRGWDKWFAEHGKDAEVPDNHKCLWVSVTDAWTELSEGVDTKTYYGMTAASDTTLRQYLEDAIRVVDSRFTTEGDIFDIFVWNDEIAASKEQTVTVLRTAADLVDTGTDEE